MAKEQRIQDIPSFKKAQSDAKDLEALKNAMSVLRGPIELIGIDADQLDNALKDAEEIKESSKIHSTSRSIHDHFVVMAGLSTREKLQVAKTALEKADSETLKEQRLTL